MSRDNDAFNGLPLFEGMNPDQRALLQEIFIPCDIYAGDLLFSQGDPAEYLYIIVKGEIVVNFKPEDGPPLNVARVRRNGIVGWSAALGSRTYTSGAESAEYSQLLRVRGSDLRRLCELHPDTGVLILDRLATVIAERLKNTHAQVVALLEIGLRSVVHTTGG
jgi:CRP/FNR family transcriptional regulator, cyclic AMP receptor protein